MDFFAMKKSIRQLTFEQNRPELYSIKVGNDIIEVYTNYSYVMFPFDLTIELNKHYIGTTYVVPTNPGRTVALLCAVQEEFKKLLLLDLEKEIKEIACLPDKEILEETYHGKRFYFSKGTHAIDVYFSLFRQYDALYNQVSGGKHWMEIFCDIYKDLKRKRKDGFLKEAIYQDLRGLI